MPRSDKHSSRWTDVDGGLSVRSLSPALRRRMMMAFDSSHTPPSRLDDATVNAVREALRLYLADSSNPGALQRALLQLSAEARDRNLHAEQLLVLLKDIWYALPEVRTMTDTTEQVRLLQRVVTMCIKEYYSA